MAEHNGAFWIPNGPKNVPCITLIRCDSVVRRSRSFPSRNASISFRATILQATEARNRTESGTIEASSRTPRQCDWYGMCVVNTNDGGLVNLKQPYKTVVSVEDSIETPLNESTYTASPGGIGRRVAGLCITRRSGELADTHRVPITRLYPSIRYIFTSLTYAAFTRSRVTECASRNWICTCNTERDQQDCCVYCIYLFSQRKLTCRWKYQALNCTALIYFWFQ